MSLTMEGWFVPRIIWTSASASAMMGSKAGDRLTLEDIGTLGEIASDTARV
jgi:hypothetical protein